MEKVWIYDTTLRDGTQGEGISLSVEDKLKIAQKLDFLGVDYIEGGWPGSNPKDMEFFQRVQELNLNHAQIAAFGSTRRPGITAEEDANLRSLIEANTPVITIFGKSWDFHVTTALRTTLEENLAMIRESVAYLKSHGRTVMYDAEHFFDGYKKNPAYAMETLRGAQEAGAQWLVLCDTNGGCLPGEITEIVGQVKAALPGVNLGIHVHNDGDMAVANSVVGVEAGVRQVQGTINGLGERCGNANLCSIIPNLQIKLSYSCLREERLATLTETAHYISEIANVHTPNNQPFVGLSAFAHKGGMHVSALLKDPETYEHMNPGRIGNRRRVLMSELAGFSNLVYKAKELGWDIDPEKPESRKFIEKIKEMEHQGYQFEGAEASLELLLRRADSPEPEPFTLEYFKILVEKRAGDPSDSEAIVKLRVGDQVLHTAAAGNGPVNALDNALRKALELIYPDLKEVHLADYKVRVLDEKDATGAKVRVLIESRDNYGSWSTVGVSENIIEASWHALIDGIVYGLFHRKGKK